MEYVLRTNNLTKRYGEQISVNNLCLNVAKKDIYGFIGRNGAGKSTTLKMILGLIKATSGTIEAFGREVKDNDISYLRDIGSIIEFPAAYEDLTAYENLKLHNDYLKLNNTKLIDECLDKVGLLKDRNKKVKNFSLGMKQRLGIARAIMHEPKILILDEPTNGLDPFGIRDLRKFILRLVDENDMTFIISSHILSELEFIITRLGILDKGVLLKEISMDEVNRSYEEYADIKVNDVKRAQMILKNKFNINVHVLENNNLRIDLKEKDIMTNEISRELVKNDVDLFQLSIHKENLEDYFVRVSGGVKL